MKTFKNTRRLAVALALIFSLTAANNAKASTENDIVPVAFKYIGTNNNAPIFQLLFSNEKVETFTVTIRDKDKVLFSETLKGSHKTLVRKYKFINEGDGMFDDEQITIEVKNISTGKEVVYSFNTGETPAKGYDLVALK